MRVPELESIVFCSRADQVRNLHFRFRQLPVFLYPEGARTSTFGGPPELLAMGRRRRVRAECIRVYDLLLLGQRKS